MRRIFNRKPQKPVRQFLRTHSTRTEILLWLGLKDRQLEGYKFRRQHGILDYIADFYCPELRLVIEIDGISHDSPEAKERDQRRQRAIESFGIEVLRFRDEDVNANVDRVLREIRDEVMKRKGGR